MVETCDIFSGDRDAEGDGELRLYGSPLALKYAFDGFIEDLVDRLYLRHCRESLRAKR